MKLRLDYGPELTSVTLEDWAEEHGVLLEFIMPGRPMQNGFIPPQTPPSAGIIFSLE